MGPHADEIGSILKAATDIELHLRLCIEAAGVTDERNHVLAEINACLPKVGEGLRLGERGIRVLAGVRWDSFAILIA